MDHPAYQSGRRHPGCNHRCREHRSVPYAGHGDSIPAAPAGKPIEGTRMTAPEADLSGWSASPFTGGGYTHDVYRKGTGPGVVLIPEIPGIHPGVLGLGNHLVDNGFTVAIPSLFGEPGRGKDPGYVISTIARACVAREFAALATNKQRPVSVFLRALARDLNKATPGKGVGVIGHCFTGGFALAAAVDDAVLAPVLSQPSVPFPLTAAHRRDPGLSESELATVAD